MRDLFAAGLLLSAFALLGNKQPPQVAITEKNYEEGLKQIIEYYGTLTHGAFQGKGNVKISYLYAKGDDSNAASGFSSTASNSKQRAIIVLPGRTESALKYTELVASLAGHGYPVLVMDLRGQGFSGRMTENRDLGYVENFSDYVDDLKRFIDEVVEPRGYSSQIVIGHSIGALIASTYMVQYPHHITKAVFSAPAFGLNLGVNETLGLAVLDIKAFFYGYDDYAPLKGSYDPEATFDGNLDTHSVARFQMTKDLFRLFPETVVGGPSSQWVSEIIAAGHLATEHADKLNVPIKIFMAGDEELVPNTDQEVFCAKAKNCDLVVVPGANHEILFETDDIRNRVLQQIFAFIAPDPAIH